MLSHYLSTLAVMNCLRKASSDYFIDWSTSQCVQSCNGNTGTNENQPPDEINPSSNDNLPKSTPHCNGRPHNLWEELFNSLEECCTIGLYWKQGECLQTGDGAGASENGNNAEPNFFVEWSDFRCVEDCYGAAPCANRARDFWEEPYLSLEDCCYHALSWKPECIVVSKATSPSAPLTNPPTGRETFTPFPSPTGLSDAPTVRETAMESVELSAAPSMSLTEPISATTFPSNQPTCLPSISPSRRATVQPSNSLTEVPSIVVSGDFSGSPSSNTVTGSPTAQNQTVQTKPLMPVLHRNATMDSDLLLDKSKSPSNALRASSRSPTSSVTPKCPEETITQSDSALSVDERNGASNQVQVVFFNFVVVSLALIYLIN